MTREMVGMGVGNKGAGLRIPWVEPQVGFRQVQAAVEGYFNQRCGRLHGCRRLEQRIA
jgi:hypothetical protein